MKTIAMSLMLLLVVASQPATAAVEYEIGVHGPFILITEASDFKPRKLIALRRSIVTSVLLNGSTVVVRTSEMDLNETQGLRTKHEAKDAPRPKPASFAIYKFVADDDKEAQKLFDVIMVELVS